MITLVPGSALVQHRSPKRSSKVFLDKVKTFGEPEEEQPGSKNILKDPESVYLKTFVLERQGKLLMVTEMVLVPF